MAQESLVAAFATPAILDQSDGGVTYVLATRWTSTGDGTCDAGIWWRPLTGPGTNPCTLVLYRVSGQVLLASKDFNGGLGSGNVTINFDTPAAITAGTAYAIGVRTNRYTARTGASSPASAFPYSNGEHLSASGGSFDEAPSGILFPSQIVTSLYYVSPVVTIASGSRTSIFLGGLRKLGALAQRRKLAPILVRNRPQPVSAQVEVNYRFSSFGRKWRITMFTDRIDSEFTQRVQAGVEADANGLPYDPTGATVQWAFLASTLAKPQAGDWKAGTWDVTRIGSYVAQCNVGPDGVVELQPGNYYAWIKIADPVAGETPGEQLGKLIVT